MRTHKEWKYIEQWVHDLSPVQLILYIDDIRKLRDGGLLHDSIFWGDSLKLLDMLYIEFVNRFRQQVEDDFENGKS